MVIDTNAGPEHTLVDGYIERMVDLQTKISEANKELQLVRQDAKINGIDLDALNFLVQVRSRNKNDKGVLVLTNLVAYAHVTGTPLRVVVERDAPASEFSDSTMPMSGDFAEDDNKTSPRGFLIKATWGMVVAATLLWFLT